MIWSWLSVLVVVQEVEAGAEEQQAPSGQEEAEVVVAATSQDGSRLQNSELQRQLR